MNLQDWLPPYEMEAAEKTARLVAELNVLNRHHWDRCRPYQNVVKSLFGGIHEIDSLARMPWLPVSLFKTVELSSVPAEQVVKVMASSGTSGMTPSRIVLDAETATVQARTLVSIVKEFLPERRPMLVIDERGSVDGRSGFNARAAAILGFAKFGADHTYLLDDDLQPRWDVLAGFLDRYGDQPIFVFGFTWLVWERFVNAASKAGRRFDFPESTVMIHGGGWKKLQQQAVSNELFKNSLADQFGIKHVYDYYGMIEQVGSIYMECAQGVLHAPSYADIIVRSPETLDVLPANTPGLIQTFSVLPQSYPGHSLLTEDMGAWLGEDDCPCGRKGKYFHVRGRLPKAELRGCSDVIALRA